MPSSPPSAAARTATARRTRRPSSSSARHGRGPPCCASCLPATMTSSPRASSSFWGSRRSEERARPTRVASAAGWTARSARSWRSGAWMPMPRSASMQAAEAEGLTTKAFYRRLQGWVAPRILVDKSPSYALDPAALAEGRGGLRGCSLHPPGAPSAAHDRLVRAAPHGPGPVPARALVRSPPARRAGLDAQPPHDHAASWSASPETAGSACTSRSSSRTRRVQMEALCARLGLRFDPAVLQPYDGLEDKMVDGVYPESAPMGDPGFLAHGSIDPSARRGVGRGRRLGASRPADRGAGGQPGIRPRASRRHRTGARAALAGPPA